MSELPDREFDGQKGPPSPPTPAVGDGAARPRPWQVPAQPEPAAAGEAIADPGPAPAPAEGAHRRPAPTATDQTGEIDPEVLAAIRARYAGPGPAGPRETGSVTTPYGQQPPRGGRDFGPPVRAGAPEQAAERGFTMRGPLAGPPDPNRPWGSPPPPGAWPGGQPDWGYAQGSGGASYADTIRSSEMVPTHRLPPRRGWRKVVFAATFGLINPGPSPDERYEAELNARVRSLLRGTYKIGVLGKGGVGKSTIAASVGSIFAELRQDDRVVAVDADTAFGKLSSRIDPSATGSYWELAADGELNTFTDMRSQVGSNNAGLFVLAGESATAKRRILDPAVYRAATAQLDRHFTLSLVDCSSTMDSPVTREVLGDVDALIVVTSPWYDGASAAGQTLDWLANAGFAALLHRTVIVVNDADGHADKKEILELVERFGKYGQKAMAMPFDAHLRPGGLIDVINEVNPGTRRRLLELAAECAEHFAATADRPRGRR